MAHHWWGTKSITGFRLRNLKTPRNMNGVGFLLALVFPEEYDPGGLGGIGKSRLVMWLILGQSDTSSLDFELFPAFWTVIHLSILSWRNGPFSPTSQVPRTSLVPELSKAQVFTFFLHISDLSHILLINALLLKLIRIHWRYHQRILRQEFSRANLFSIRPQNKGNSSANHFPQINTLFWVVIFQKEKSEQIHLWNPQMPLNEFSSSGPDEFQSRVLRDLTNEITTLLPRTPEESQTKQRNTTRYTNVILFSKRERNSRFCRQKSQQKENETYQTNLISFVYMFHFTSFIWFGFGKLPIWWTQDSVCGPYQSFPRCHSQY